MKPLPLNAAVLPTAGSAHAQDRTERRTGIGGDDVARREQGTMRATAISATAFVMLLVVVLVGPHRAVEGKVDASAPVEDTSPPAPVEHGGEGFLFGHVTTQEGTTYAGRLRFGRDEEAFWGDYFNGFKDQNPWADQAPVAGLTQKRRSFTIFGFEIPLGTHRVDIGRPFMSRASATSRGSRREDATCG